MNKLFVSAGLVAIGAATLESAMADDATGPKYWSVGGTLRGFYDDNYNFTSSKKGSFGVEILPTVSFHVPLRQTDLGLRYTYGAYWYQDRQVTHQNPWDQTHQLDLWVDHAFNERWKTRLTDTFAVGQEPELLNPNSTTAFATPLRVAGDNFSNHGAVELNTQWTRLLSTVLSYDNGWYAYDNSGAAVDPTTGVFYNNPPGPTLAGLLDRDEESVAFDLRWSVLPETIAFVGYSFSWVNYLGDEPIAAVNLPTLAGPFIYHSSARDSDTHYGYVGIQQNFTANLNAMLKVGASYTDAYNDPLFPSTSWNPYADLSISYTYLPGCYAQLGFTHDVGATDQVAPDNSGRITQYAENSVVYADVNHRITQKLTGTVIGRVQYTTYKSGAAGADDMTDYSVGVNLSYQFNLHLSMDVGYNFDDVVSNIAGYQFTRNRVYLGLTAIY